MQTYWQVFRDVLKMLVWLVIIVVIGIVITSALCEGIIWLFGISPILGGCTIVVLALFGVTTVTYIFQTDY